MIVTLLTSYYIPIRMYWGNILVLMAAFVSATSSADT